MFDRKTKQRRAAIEQGRYVRPSQGIVNESPLEICEYLEWGTRDFAESCNGFSVEWTMDSNKSGKILWEIGFENQLCRYEYQFCGLDLKILRRIVACAKIRKGMSPVSVFKGRDFLSRLDTLLAKSYKRKSESENGETPSSALLRLIITKFSVSHPNGGTSNGPNTSEWGEEDQDEIPKQPAATQNRQHAMTMVGRVLNVDAQEGKVKALLGFMPTVWECAGRVQGYDLGKGNFHIRF
ncbi:unnamed protein product [Cochlearia groenlandica]